MIPLVDWSESFHHIGRPGPSPSQAGGHGPYDDRIDSTRIDRWLWSVRLYKTRSAASAACRGGHVTVNGSAAKPATPVRVGDTVEASIGPRLRIAEVTRVIDKRVGAPVAAGCYLDHSPPPPPRELTAPAFTRDRGSGRPTKRDRRRIDRLRNQNR